MKIDHIGITVKSLDEGIEHWKKIFGYKQITEIITNIRQKVKVVFLSKKNSISIKLMEPLDSTSPVYMFSRRGGGLHHFKNVATVSISFPFLILLCNKLHK